MRVRDIILAMKCSNEDVDVDVEIALGLERRAEYMKAASRIPSIMEEPIKMAKFYYCQKAILNYALACSDFPGRPEGLKPSETKEGRKYMSAITMVQLIVEEGMDKLAEFMAEKSIEQTLGPASKHN